MPTNTLSTITQKWKTLNLGGFAVTTIRQAEGQTLDVFTSRSGSGMLGLTGIEVFTGGKWWDAHLSFPPDSSGLGEVSEGHLKIEGGPLLNQYFFEVTDADAWELEKMSNSNAVKTQNPGKWDSLSSDLWKDIDNLATLILFT